MEIIIRQENENDYSAVYDLNAIAFGQNTESKLVESLRKSTAFRRSFFTERSFKTSSSIVLIMYSNPFTLERNSTDSPSARLRISRTASKPYHDVCHFTLFISLRLNCDPVKNVATAVPINSGPSKPLSKRKKSKVFWPKILFGFDLNSYATA